MKAKIIVPINWDPDGTGIGAEFPGPNAMEIDVEVNPGDEPVTVVFTEDGVKMTSKTEPRLVTIPEVPDATGT